MGGLHHNLPGWKGQMEGLDEWGTDAAWSRNRKDVFYKDQTDDFFACPINAKVSEVAVGKPQRLFHASTPGIGSSFDVSLDGKRLIVNHADEEMQAPLHLVTNWLADLKK